MGKVKLDLGDDNDDAEEGLKINEDYKKSYESWRSREVLQKLKDKYKNKSLNEDEDSDDDSTSESEPEWTADDEKGFLRALGALKSNDPKIYDKNQRFFIEKSGNEEGPSTKPKKVKEPEKIGMTLRDYEVALVTERKGKFDDEDVGEEPHDEGYYERSRRLKDEFKAVALKVEGDDEEESGFLKKKQKTVEEKKQEEEDYAEWLKGEGKGLKFAADDDMSKLKHAWNQPELDQNEQFLRDYLLEKKYDVDDEKEGETYDDIIEDEEQIEKAENFENKYNFRFEEPDQEFIKQFPRTVKESVRPVNEKRKETREQIKKRKEEEKRQRKEEIKLLKQLKKKEMEEKLEKVKKLTGGGAIPMSTEDLEKDFDPEEHDKQMKELFAQEDDDGDLDYEDILPDNTRTKFKYRPVLANSFGLSTEEILVADDRQLNQWVSVKKASQYRTEKDEEYDRKIYEQKALSGKKEKIFSKKRNNLDEPAPSEGKNSKKVSKQTQPSRQEEPPAVASKRKNRRKNKSSKKFQNGQKIDGLDINRLKAYDVSNKTLKRKIYGNANQNGAKKPKIA